MLTQLSIKNFAIIDELEIVFKDGLTVLTGETGAGKSIIVDENTFPGYYEEIFKQVGKNPAEEFFKLIKS